MFSTGTFSADELLQSVALDHAHAAEGREHAEIEEMLLFQGEGGPLQFEAVQIMSIDGADQAADAGADDQIDGDLFLLQHPDDAHMGESAGSSPAQHQSYSGRTPPAGYLPSNRFA